MTGIPDSTVDLVLGFLNTVDVEKGTDVLSDAATYEAWLRGRGLSGGGAGGEPDTARAVRDALRAAATGVGLPAPALEAVDLRMTLRAGGTPALDSPDPLGVIMAAAVRLGHDGRWHRVRLCSATDCRWAFYDRSKNRSRQWCAMAVCGNRTKSRAFRQRSRQKPSSRRQDHPPAMPPGTDQYRRTSDRG